MQEYQTHVVAVVATVAITLLAIRVQGVLLCNRYVTARLLLLLSALLAFAGFFMAVAIALVSVPAILVVGVFLLWATRKQTFQGGWSHGTARFATTTDAAYAGLLYPGGIPLGMMPPPKLNDALRLLVKLPVRHSDLACRLLASAVFRKPMPATSNHAVHAVSFMPVGKGKSSGVAIPYMLSCDDSMIVLDIKAELFKETAEFRSRAFGHRIVVLDPFGLTGRPSDSLNPLGHTATGKTQLDDIAAIAASVIHRTGKENEPHWDDASETHVYGIAALLATHYEQSNLQVVADVLADQDVLAKARIELRESTAHDGMLARVGNQLSQFKDKELASVLTTTARHLRFLNTPSVKAVTETSSFDPRDLASDKQKMTIYIVIPPDKLESLAGLIRAWITTLIRCIVNTGLKPQGKIRFILDEAASIGKLDAIENAITQLRGYGVSMLFFYQSMGQLKKVYSEGQHETFLTNMDVQIFAGTNGYEEAEYISNAIGETTIVTHSYNGGSGSSLNHDPTGLTSRGTNQNAGWSTQEIGRKLLKPEEILRHNERTAIVLTSGCPPLITRLVRYYEREFWDNLFSESPAKALKQSLAIFLACAAIFGSLCLLTLPVSNRPVRTQTAPPAPQAAWPYAPQLQPQNSREVDEILKHAFFQQATRPEQGPSGKLVPLSGAEVDQILRGIQSKPQQKGGPK